MDRRKFVKILGISGLVWGIDNVLSPIPSVAENHTPTDIGFCKQLKITCVSEVGWWNTKELGRNIEHSCKQAGLDEQKCGQYQIPLSMRNGAGNSALIEMQTMDGTTRRILLDTGWNPTYMSWRFQRTWVDQLLAERKIDLLVVSHEHFDHFYGLEAVLKIDPTLTMVIPSTFGPKGRKFIEGANFKQAHARNAVKHQGKLMVMKQGGVHKLFDGAGLAVFDVPIGADVRGEQSLIFNIKDRGIVLVSGCCHQTITRLANFARHRVKGGDTLYGLYGGLHIAPIADATDKLTPAQEAVVRGIGKYGFKMLACNHCTGLPAVKYMRKLGYPVIGGSGREGSLSNLYVGHSDIVEFNKG